MNHEVLVLNSDYEPLNVCHVRRAIVLVYLGKADVLHTDGTMRTLDSTAAFATPTVVKLRAHVKRPCPNSSSPDGRSSRGTTISASTAALRRKT